MEHFLSEDKEKAVRFSQFLIQHAKWNVDTAQACELTKHLAWFNTLVPKIESHIFEVQKVHEPKAKAK